jgi:ADP-ribose pyrophosphatase
MSFAENVEIPEAHRILFKCRFYQVIDQNGYFVITEKFDINAAVIIAKNDAGEFLIARHMRPAIGKISVEFPRGGRELNETTDTTAKRELTEETGYSAEFTQHLGSLHSNTSLIKSAVDVYLLTGLTLTDVEPDGEIASLSFVAQNDINRMIVSGEITDGHTLSALAMLSAFEATHKVNGNI